MNLVLISDHDDHGVRRIVVDAQGEAASRATAVLSDIRDTWAPTAGHNVDGAGEDREGGVVRWTFVFGGERGHDALESSDESSDDSTSSTWTITTEDQSSTVPG